jgi:hypothetical protein
MLKISIRLIALISAAAVAACAPVDTPAETPSGAHVETLQTLRLVVHGTASARPSASCGSVPSSPPVYVRLTDEISGDFTLRPLKGAAVLHVQELATSKTWCAMTRDDGTGAVIEGEFPGGVFAIRVEGESVSGATPFEVVVERL